MQSRTWEVPKQKRIKTRVHWTTAGRGSTICPLLTALQAADSFDELLFHRFPHRFLVLERVDHVVLFFLGLLALRLRGAALAAAPQAHQAAENIVQGAYRAPEYAAAAHQPGGLLLLLF